MQTRAGLVARWSAVVVCFSLATSISLFALAAVVMMLAWALEGNWRGWWAQLRHQPALGLLLAFIAWMYVSSTWTEATPQTLDEARGMQWRLLLVPVMMSLLAEGTWRRRCWMAFGAGMAVLLTHVFLVQITPLPWTATQDPAGVFFNPNPQSVGLAIFSAWCLFQLINSHGSRAYQALLLVLLAGSTYAVFHVSQQRVGFLGWLAGCATVLGLSLSTRQRWWALAGLSVVLAGMVASSPRIQDRILLAVQEARAFNPEDVAGNLNSVGARLQMWYVSAQAVGQSPLVGQGIGSYPVVAEAAFDNADMCAIGCWHPHNLYLFYAVEFGLIGLGLFLAAVVLALVAHRPCRRESILPLAVLLVFLMCSLVDTSLWYRGFLYLFTPLLALSLLGPASASAQSEQLDS
jgi:O-antigen ligase